MKTKLVATLGLSTLLLLTGCGQKAPTTATGDKTAAPGSTPAEAPSESTPADALATVNGRPLTRMEFAAMLMEWQRRRPDASINSPQIQSQLFNEMINLMLVSQDAEAKGVDKSPQVQAALTWARTRVLAETMLAQHLQGHPITDEELKKVYDERYAGKSQKEYKASHILLKTEAEAKAVIDELAKGADFAQLAKQRSTGPSASKGGDLGWFSASDMVPPFAEALATMEKGSTSKTPVKTQFGWHVIRLEDVRETAPPSFEAVKDDLLTELRQKVINDYVASLRKGAEIKPVAHPSAAKPEAAGTPSNPEHGEAPKATPAAAAPEGAAPAKEPETAPKEAPKKASAG
jgi:peptidyl-prolyl cis-trans isomerase C